MAYDVKLIADAERQSVEEKQSKIETVIANLRRDQGSEEIQITA